MPDIEKMKRLFREGKTWVQVAAELGISYDYARDLGIRHGLRRRKPIAVQYAEAAARREAESDQERAPSPEDEAASEDSLRLSPYVLRRIEELGIHGRRVQPQEAWSLPVFTGG